MATRLCGGWTAATSGLHGQRQHAFHSPSREPVQRGVNRLGAQEGEHTGGYVNVVTRSGTNISPVPLSSSYATTSSTRRISTLSPPTRCTKMNSAVPLAAPSSTTSSLPLPVPAAELHQAAGQYQGFCSDGGEPDRRLLRDRRSQLRVVEKTVQLVDPLTGTPLTGDKYATPPAYLAQSLALEKYLPAINPAVRYQQLRRGLLFDSTGRA